MIRFTCKCGQQIKVEEKHAGKNGKCPHCGIQVKIPSPQDIDNQKMKSVVCGKCQHKQDVPEGLENNIFVCEKCGSSTLPASQTQATLGLKIQETENDTIHENQAGSSHDSYHSKQSNSNLLKRSTRIHSSFVPERFSQYIAPSESIMYASNPSLVSLILQLIGPVLALIVIVISTGQERFEEYNAIVMPAIIVVLIIMTLLIFSWKFTYYLVTDKKVFSSSGVFNRRITIIPIANIHTISVNTGIIDSLLGLNSIVFSSAGNGGTGFIFRWFPFMTAGTLTFKYVSDAPEICRHVSG